MTRETDYPQPYELPADVPAWTRDMLLEQNAKIERLEAIVRVQGDLLHKLERTTDNHFERHVSTESVGDAIARAKG